METAWYFRLFYVHISGFIISWLLYGIIRAKRMTGPGPSKPWVTGYWISFIVGWVLMWFIPFSINLAFWVGLGIIVLGEAVYALGYIAMREHLPPDILALTVNKPMYRQLCELDENSFLYKPFWKRLRKARGQAAN